MKFTTSASSIVFLTSFFLLAGCDSLGLPNLLRHDEVPPEVKAVPRTLEAPPLAMEDNTWPRLGDVPFKPKDFSPKPVYDHYMDELEFHRDEAEAAKKKALAEDPVLDDVAPQNNQAPVPQPPSFPKE